MNPLVRLSALGDRFALPRVEPRPSLPHPRASEAPSAGSRPARLRLAGLFTASFALLAFCGIGPPVADAAGPTLTVEPVTEHGITRALLSGKVSYASEGDGGSEGYWYFQYCRDESPGECSAASQWSYGPEAFSHTLPAATTAEPVKEELGNLAADTEYTVRLVAMPFSSFAEVPCEEADPEACEQSFTTDPAPVAPTASLDPPSQVGYTSARITGLLDPEGGNEENTPWLASSQFVRIHWAVEISETGEPGSFSEVDSTDVAFPEKDYGPGEGAEVVAEPSNLSPGHLYHFRLHVTWAGQTLPPEPEGEFTTLPAAKPTVTIEAPSLVNLNQERFYLAGHVNPNSPRSAAEIEAMKAGTPEEAREAEDIEAAFATSWSFNCEPSCNGPGGNLAADDTAHLVDGEVSGLQPNTRYTITLHATNTGGAATAQAVFKTPATPPNVTPLTNYSNEAGEVVLRGRIDPRNSELTGCRFLYGPAGAPLGHSVDCSAPVAVPESNDVEVSASIAGLPAASAFRYRLLATNQAGTGESEERPFETLAEAHPEPACANEARREEQHSRQLPDCRAYEMVSPPDKAGGDISATPSRTRIATDGNAVQFVSGTGFGDARGTNTIGPEYLAERGPEGWATHAITPPQEPPALATWRSRYVGDFSPDLNTGVYFALNPVNSEEPDVANLRNLYLRTDLLSPGPGTYRLLSGCSGCTEPLPSLAPSQLLEDPALAATSTDFSHVIFESPVRLTSDAPDNQPEGCAFQAQACHSFLYESVNGRVRLAGMVPPPGQTECSGSECEPAAESVAGAGALNADGLGTTTDTHETMSSDGSRIVFTAGPFTEPGSLGLSVTGHMGNLYLREDDTRTVQLNASERSEPTESQPALFGGASRDGSRIFFLTGQLLTDDATPGGGLNLYMYDVNAPVGHHLTLITHDTEPADDSGFNRAVYVTGVSEDGSYVYFWGVNGLLPGLGSSGNATKQLYVWHEGALRFIAVDGDSGFHSNWGEDGLNLPGLPPEFRTTPDGRHIVFTTHSFATAASVGFDNESASGPEGRCEGFCKQVYLYSYGSDRLACASCPPHGARPDGEARIATSSDDSVQITATQHLNHALTNEGSRVFFDTTDPLVQADTNGARDAYSYDAATGRKSLLSSGRSPAESLFVEATPDGSDVLFTTREQLLSHDVDHGVDLYDARVNGGIAAQNAPPPLLCEGEACKGAGPTPPPPVDGGSETFAGPPNPHPRRHHHRRHRHHHRRHRTSGRDLGGAK